MIFSDVLRATVLCDYLKNYEIIVVMCPFLCFCSFVIVVMGRIFVRERQSVFYNLRIEELNKRFIKEFFVTGFGGRKVSSGKSG